MSSDEFKTLYGQWLIVRECLDETVCFEERNNLREQMRDIEADMLERFPEDYSTIFAPRLN